MAVYKCKMCGGSLEVKDGLTICECEYCGTKQTLPKTDNEQNLNLFNRANHFRQLCEFDKAAEIYEKMISNSNNDAELYWSLVLCRYGIEYIDDPLTKKKIPTCHRTQYKSILNDPDYLSALDNADAAQRTIYENEAAYIDKVQKGILEISNKEEPFDVFICYKETDEHGRRTPDSVLAQELYYCLIQEGFKVFFSRITLESKLGAEYEPYIFSALNSAKVMVVVGTKPEYFNAVWVRNEWSRYLLLMQNDKERTLIPAYRDMDPYNLPDELSMFQAQDMSKLGFMQDLIRGIKKLVVSVPQEPVVKENVVKKASSSNVDNLIKRGNLALEDGKWDEANNFFEQVLNENVEEYRAYIGKLCAEMKVSNEQDLVKSQRDFTTSDNYRKACRFGGDVIENRLFEYNQKGLYDFAVSKFNTINNSEIIKVQQLFVSLGNFLDAPQKALECKNKELQIKYDIANKNMELAKTKAAFINVQQQFENLGDFMDSLQKANECSKKAQEAHKNDIYNNAVKLMNNSSIADIEMAISKFENISDWKDSLEKLDTCKLKIKELEESAQARREASKREVELSKKSFKNKMIIAVSCCAAIIGILGIVLNIPKKSNYKFENDISVNEKVDNKIDVTDNYDEEITDATTTIASEELSDNNSTTQQSYQRPVSGTAPAAGDPDYAPLPYQYDYAGLTYINGILISNKSYSLPADFNPGIDPTCQAQFNKLASAAAQQGLNIYISSGFRSYDYQAQIYNNYVARDGQAVADTYSARPGYSEHQTGLAIDVNQIDDSFIGTPEAIWLEKHCHEFGFILRYPQGKQDITGYNYEPWHIRYVGTDLAYKIHDSGLTIEEYFGIDSYYH